MVVENKWIENVSVFFFKKKNSSIEKSRRGQVMKVEL